MLDAVAHWVVVHVSGGNPSRLWFYPISDSAAQEKAFIKAKAIVRTPSFDRHRDTVQIFRALKDEDGVEPELMHFMLHEWQEESFLGTD